jgi:diguanylate cyclase (GGDEF)-like protein
MRTPVRASALGSEADRTAAELSMVLDSVGGLLQVYAHHAFDTDLHTGDTFRAILQHWRMHAVIGMPAPTPMGEFCGAEIVDRDWNGLLRFFGDARREEVSFVVRGQKNLRESIWAFVSGLHKLVVDEHAESEVALEHIDRVRVAVASNDCERLMRETTAAVAVMERLVETRRARQKKEFAVLTERLGNLGHELEDARRESCLDALTGLPNRKEFDAFVQRSIELHTITGRPACLLIVNIDNFMNINNADGQPMGDEALRQVTLALSRTVLRKVDFIARFGGDEFAIVLQETDAHSAKVLGDNLRSALRDVLEVPRDNEQNLDFTLSVGIAELVMGDDGPSWTRRVNQAKDCGPDQVNVYADLGAMVG